MSSGARASAVLRRSLYHLFQQTRAWTLEPCCLWSDSSPMALRGWVSTLTSAASVSSVRWGPISTHCWGQQEDSWE